MLVEGHYREAIGDWAKAGDIYRTLFRRSSDNLEYGLRLAGAQTSAGKGQDALVTADALRNLPLPARDDPRIDRAERAAADSLGDFQRERAAAAKAIAKAQARNAGFVTAAALWDECWASQQLGQNEQAAASCEQARNLYAQAGNRDGEAHVLNSMAVGFLGRGELSQAKAKFQESLSVFRDIGDRSGVASTRANIAIVLTRQGDYKAAKRMFEGAIATF